MLTPNCVTATAKAVYMGMRGDFGAPRRAFSIDETNAILTQTD